MINISVKVPKNFGVPSDKTMQRILTALAAYAREKLTTLAQQRLSAQIAPEYIRALNLPKSLVFGKSMVSLQMASPLGSMLETGRGSFSIKEAMLKSSPKARAKGYVDVPFRHGSPGATRFPAMPAADLHAMESRAYATRGGGGVMRGPRSMPTPPMKKESGYIQRVSKYADMLKIPKAYVKSNGSMHVTIRRISANSEAGSWMHPGLKGIHLFAQVKKEIEKVAPKLVKDYLKNGGG